MSRPSSPSYMIGSVAIASKCSLRTAQNEQASTSDDTLGFGGLRPSTVQPELFTLLPRQCSYPSGLIKVNREINDPTACFSPFAGAGLTKNRSLYAGVSRIQTTNKVQSEDEFVPQKLVDVLSDGVYLLAASQDSFIGVSLSPSVDPTTFIRSRLSVQLDGPPSPSDILSRPKSPLQIYNSSLTLPEVDVPCHVPQLPNEPSNVEQGAYQHAQNHHRRGLKALPATLPGPAHIADVVGGVTRPKPATERSSRTSVSTYSNLKKVDSQSPTHDFAVVIVERESSGETDYSEPTNHEDASIQSSEHSIAAKAANIIRDWNIESNSEEQQRLEWEVYGKGQLKTSPACHKAAWRKDLLVRDCQHQIRTKLRNGHVFILQKLPPVAFNTKIITCAHPYCPAPQKRSPPASYRLSLEPKKNLTRTVPPTEPLYAIHVIERRVGKVEEGLRGRGEDGVTWYCLTCVEDLWSGVGMLQGQPQAKRKRRGDSRRKATTTDNKPFRLSGGASPAKSTHHPDPSSPSPLRKKAKLYLRGPRTPPGTTAAMAMTQSENVTEDASKSVTPQGLKKVQPRPDRPLPTHGEELAGKASTTLTRGRIPPSPSLTGKIDTTTTAPSRADPDVQDPFPITTATPTRPTPRSPTPNPTHASPPPPPHLPPSPSSTPDPALASIAHFIHAETRTHPSGHYTLSSPQLFALRRWKAVINYRRIFYVHANRRFMERNGLDHVYADADADAVGEVGVDVLQGREEGGGWEVEGEGGAATRMGVMEVGGLVVEVSKGEVAGRELSLVLGDVDGRVGEELVRLGWGGEGVERLRERERGKVRLRLRVGERESDEERERGAVRLTLRVDRKDVEGHVEEE